MFDVVMCGVLRLDVVRLMFDLRWEVEVVRLMFDVRWEVEVVRLMFDVRWQVEGRGGP